MGHAELNVQAQAAQAQGLAMQNHWMPFTPNRDFHASPQLAARAEGMYYWDPAGNKILDASSGLFCVAAGHARREIADAVHAQMMQLDYIPPFLRSHSKAFELANRIAAITPGNLNSIFFCNSGSEAVDTAMKMCLAYHRVRGQAQRQMFISRERAYHGVGFGGVSLSGLVNNRRAFGLGLNGVAHMRHTHIPQNKFERGEGSHGIELAEDLQRLINLYGAENIAGVFIEPVAGSTGCLVPPKGYLKRVREICDANNLLLVFDEVINGIGRMGNWFAAHSFDVTPDILTMAKAITNGVQPLGVVAAREDIQATINGAQSNPNTPEFFHGYTYSAHPVPVAAALATLDIYESEKLIEKARDMSPYFLDAVWSLRDLPIVTDIRGYASMAAFDVAMDGAPGNRGHVLQKRLYENGLHLKATGDAAILAPAYVAEKSHIDEMVDKLRRVLKTF